MDIVNVLSSGHTSRFHAVAGVTNQEVSSHSWGVAVLIQYIYPECSKDLLLAALYHDCAEAVTGDIPALMKWSTPEVKEAFDKYELEVELKWGIHINLSEKEQKFLKIADMLEGMRYCAHRYNMGEHEAKTVYMRWKSKLITKFDEVNNHEVSEFVNTLERSMKYGS